MKIIDFHTHVFPDKIAAKTVAFLGEKAKIKAYSNGSLAGLKKSMQDAGVDISVVLPVVTKPEQFASITKFAMEISQEQGIVSYGGIHPATEHYREEIDQIASLGLPGIKLHPDYQQCYVDDERNIRVIEYAIGKGLNVVLHAGVDVGYPNPVFCPPEKIKNMLTAIPDYEKAEGKIVLAHVGGYRMWDEVETYLVGEKVYFDVAFSLGKIPDEQLLRMIRKHGEERFLFATDSPWDSQKKDVDYVKQMKLSEEQKEKLFFKNAEGLI